MIYQRLHPKSIDEVGQEFLTLLLRHFENDQPDVFELELQGEWKNEPPRADSNRLVSFRTACGVGWRC